MLPTIPASDPVDGVIIAILFVGVVLQFTLRRLGRGRPGFSIGQAIAVALLVRLLSIAAIDSTGLGASLRGGDEGTFLGWAQLLAAQPLGHGDLPHGIYQLQTVLFALQIKLGFYNVTAIRVTQIGIALLGQVFMITAVYDMVGPGTRAAGRASRFAAWFIAFEPANIFFSSEIHKEALMELSAGLIAFGGTWIWKRLDLRGIAICGLGALVGIETRSYAGWFLACGVVALLLHASLRNMRGSLGRAMPIVYGIIVAAFIVGPTLFAATGGKNLKTLQASQTANAAGTGEASITGGGNGDNLALEQVDFSSRGAIITSLPTKLRDLLLEPYPWQLGDASQMFGAVGTLIAYAVLALLIRYAWISRGRIFGRAGPLLYPFLFSMVCYSLTVGNAGTGFRYRSHLMTLGICALAILRETAREVRNERQQAKVAVPQQETFHAGRQPVPA